MHWRRKWQPTPVSCLENPRDGGTWWAAVCGVAKSHTQLKRLSSSNRELSDRTNMDNWEWGFEEVFHFKLECYCATAFHCNFRWWFFFFFFFPRTQRDSDSRGKLKCYNAQCSSAFIPKFLYLGILSQGLPQAPPFLGGGVGQDIP